MARLTCLMMHHYLRLAPLGIGLDKVGATESEDIGSICHRHQQWSRGGVGGGGQNLGLVTAMVTRDRKNETECLACLATLDSFTPFKINDLV